MSAVPYIQRMLNAYYVRSPEESQLVIVYLLMNYHMQIKYNHKVNLLSMTIFKEDERKFDE